MLKALPVILLCWGLAPWCFVTDPTGPCHKAVKYKIGYKTRTGRDKYLDLQISIKEGDVTIEDLIELACNLKNRYPREPRLAVYVFTLEEAAKKFADVYEQPRYEEMHEAWRAYYWLDRTKGEEYLEYVLGPYKVGQKMQHVDLTKRSKPH